MAFLKTADVLVGDDGAVYTAASSVAARYNVSVQQVVQWCRSGALRALEHNGAWFVCEAALRQRLSAEAARAARKKQTRRTETRAVQTRRLALPAARIAVATLALLTLSWATTYAAQTFSLPTFITKAQTQPHTFSPEQVANTLAAVEDSGLSFTEFVGDFFSSLFTSETHFESEGGVLTGDTTPPVTTTAPAVQTTTTPQVVTERIIERVIEPQTVINNVTESITYSGVSEAALTTRLEQLENELKSELYSFTARYEGQSAANYRAIQLTQRIDTLDGVTINNPTIIGGSLSGTSGAGGGASELSDLSDVATLSPSYGNVLYYDGSEWTTLATSSLSISGGASFGQNLSLITNVFSQSALAPTTTQNLAISGTGTSTFAGGLEAWRQVAAPYFHATSTTATSTFAGGLAIETSGLLLSNSSDIFWRGSGGTPVSVLEVSGDTTFLRGAGGTPTLRIDASDGTNLATFLEAGNVGFGTTSPLATLTASSTNAVGLLVDQRGTSDIVQFQDAGATVFAILDGGDVGIGTTSPWKRLSVTETVSDAQFSIAYDATRYTNFQVDSNGDFIIDAQGGDAYLNDENLWVCTGGSCPSGSPSGTGNLVVETRLGVASSTPFSAIGVSGAIVTAENDLTDGATISIDWRDGNQQRVVLEDNRTVEFSNYTHGQTLRLIVCQDSTGSRTVTWSTQILWSGGSAPTLTTTANKCDVTSFIATGATSTLKIFGASTLDF